MKKMVSLFLTLALVIGIVPVTNIPIAFAEDTAVTETAHAHQRVMLREQ